TQTLSGTNTFNNLTVNHTGAGSVTASGSTLTVNSLVRVTAGTFVSSSTYNNVQVDGGATLQSDGGTISVAGNWTNDGTFAPSTGIVSFNGAGAQTIGGGSTTTFNNLTVANTAAAVNVSPTSNAMSADGTLTVNAGAILSPSAAVVIAGNGTLTGPAAGFGTVQVTRTAATPDFLSQYTIANKTLGNLTVDYNSAGAQTVSAVNYGNLTISGARAANSVTLAPSGTIGIAGTFNPSATFAGGGYVVTGSTVEYNGSGSAQSLPSAFTTYNNLTLNNGAGTTGFSGLTVLGLIEVKSGTFTSSSSYVNVQIDGGATLAASAASTINVTGTWTNNGTFTANDGTVNLNGTLAQTVGGTSATTFNNLTVNNAGGVTLGQTENVGGTLTLTDGLITTGTNVLAIGGSGSVTRTSATSGYVIGNLKKTYSGLLTNSFVFHVGTANGYSPVDTSLIVTTGTGDLTVKAVQGPQPNLTSSTSLQRYWALTASGVTANLAFHYLDNSPANVYGTNDVAGNESAYRITRVTGGSATQFPNVCPAAPCVDTSTNTATIEAVTTFSDWTLAEPIGPTSAPLKLGGRVTTSDGTSVGGAVLQLTGSRSARVITDAEGNYRFDGLAASGFYVVTPQAANYSFSPASRTFTLLADKTDAAFTATPDRSPKTNPLDTDLFFVRQQYLDFLGREPEQGGLEYWGDEIARCGTDVSCVNSRRVGVSAAFFIEQEFQQTGSFVYRLYRAGLGLQITYAEFSQDRGRVVAGASLDESREAFAYDFVRRPEFAQKYAGADTAARFVDALLSNVRQSSGVDLASERASLIESYKAGGDTAHSRALALASAVEAAAFEQAEYNRAFVLMQYFGYLRREPDKGGYDFWLNVLDNREPGNYRGMVCSFITSREYQERFSPVVTHSNSECGR
ncbi:MAG TPA: hypothetical protein VF507_00400, partial [Pyrinomonadaceae bacterium]